MAGKEVPFREKVYALPSPPVSTTHLHHPPQLHTHDTEGLCELHSLSSGFYVGAVSEEGGGDHLYFVTTSNLLHRQAPRGAATGHLIKHAIPGCVEFGTVRPVEDKAARSVVIVQVSRSFRAREQYERAQWTELQKFKEDAAAAAAGPRSRRAYEAPRKWCEQYIDFRSLQKKVFWPEEVRGGTRQQPQRPQQPSDKISGQREVHVLVHSSSPGIQSSSSSAAADDGEQQAQVIYRLNAETDEPFNLRDLGAGRQEYKISVLPGTGPFGHNLEGCLVTKRDYVAKASPLGGGHRDERLGMVMRYDATRSEVLVLPIGVIVKAFEALIWERKCDVERVAAASAKIRGDVMARFNAEKQAGQRRMNSN